jgi:glycosyltransferase involved in cell wall biosynthesis
MTGPRLLVYTSVFPNAGQPNLGVFVRERMFRVGAHLPLVVVAPVPWFPLQGLLRLWRPHFRPPSPRLEVQDGFEVHHPRFLSLPGLLKRWDGLSMALASWRLARRLTTRPGVDLIDAHFAYPDGYAATLLGRWLGVPVTITLRGTEPSLARFPARRRRVALALQRATRLFSVSDSLRRYAVEACGVPEEKVRVVGNGVDTQKFQPVDRALARAELGVAPDARVLVSVGGLVERKGFHRVIDLLPALSGRYPDLLYLVVGGGGPEGDIGARLRAQVAALGLERHVRFLGPMPSERIKVPLSAADLFVLATSNEGWANVFLEAMACGLPVVTTDVGGNREVVSDARLGTVVPFGNGSALRAALEHGLDHHWDRAAITEHARANAWDTRVTVLCEEFRRLAGPARAAG